MNRPQLATLKACTGCLACIDVCPKDALSMYIADDGHMYVECDESRCILCHKCERTCPAVNGMVYSSNTLQRSKPFSLYCTDKKLYDNSTSGGAFVSLALSFIESGGYVCGVVADDEVKHIVTNRYDDILRMQGTKYVQSDTKGIYKEILHLIDKGRKVMFVGMGCQAAAVISYFKNNKNKDLLFVVDIICGGVPSMLLSKTFLQNEKRFSRIVGFRNKEKYVLSCFDTKGQLVSLDGQRVLPLYGFYSGLTKRYSCGDCKFCGVERLSDITIGDYWGENNLDGKHKSVVVVHTDRGMELLNGLRNVNVKRIDWLFIKYNHRFVIGKNYNNRRLQRILLPWLFKHLSYKSLCGLYGCDLRNPLWLLLNVYNHVIARIQGFYIQVCSKKILSDIEK